MTNKIKIEVEFDFDNALARSHAEPLVAAEELRAAFKGRGGYYQTMRQAMAACCAIYQNLRAKEKDWQGFLRKAAEVETPYQPRENSDLAAVIFYVFSEASYTRGIKYAAGLQLLIDEGVKPREMPTVIKERGGIDELYTESTRKKRAKTAAHAGTTTPSKRAKPGADGEDDPSDDSDDVNDSEDSTEGGHDRDQDDTEVHATAKAKKKAARLAGKLAKLAVAHGSEWILCEAHNRLCEELLKTAESATFTFTVENLGSVNGLVRFRIVDFSPG